MLIKRITKIKNVGILEHLDGTNLATPDLDFKKINIIFGWNGTGKTTLSRVVRCLELGEVCDKLKEHSTMEFDFKLHDDSILSENNKTKQNIRVFNKDFVEENIFEPSTRDGQNVKPIFYLGKEIIALTKEREEKEQKTKDEEVISREIANLSRDKENMGKDYAKLIKDSLLGIKEYQFYNIAHFTSRFEELKKEIEKGETSLVQEQLSEQDFEKKLNVVKNYESLKTWVESIGLNSSTLNLEFLQNIDTLLGKTVSIQKIIEKLRNDWELSKWVQEGLHIHVDRKSPNCEFCGQTLPTSRTEDLEKHFNKDFKDLSDLISQKIDDLEKLKLAEVAKIPDEEVRHLAELLNAKVNIILGKLKEKQKNPLEKVGFIENEILELVEALEKINSSSKETIASVVHVAKQLEQSIVASKFEIFNEKEKKIKDAEENKRKNHEEIEALDLKIKAGEKSIKDFEIPAGEINSDLEKFLGHSELKFESKKDAHDEVFYEIRRNGVVASNLSEGEKTAISLIYFLRKLSEDGFDPLKGSVFIDDPISSMDSQFMYAAYSFIISAIEKDTGELKVGQIVISTHNYEFFNLLKKKYWRDNEDHTKRRCELYMLRMKIGALGKRCSNIYELDKLLKKFESDYQYLYSRLVEFEKATDTEKDDLMKIYPYPNIARRVLETFLSFKYAARTDLQGMVNAISAVAITKDIKESVYRFINIQSHGTIKDISGFNPALLEPTAKDHILNVLKIIREVDLEHSKEMEASIK